MRGMGKKHRYQNSGHISPNLSLPLSPPPPGAMLLCLKTQASDIYGWGWGVGGDKAFLKTRLELSLAKCVFAPNFHVVYRPRTF